MDYYKYKSLIYSYCYANDETRRCKIFPEFLLTQSRQLEHNTRLGL